MVGGNGGLRFLADYLQVRIFHTFAKEIKIKNALEVVTASFELKNRTEIDQFMNFHNQICNKIDIFQFSMSM